MCIFPSAANAASITGTGAIHPSAMSGSESSETTGVGATGSSFPMLSEFPRGILRDPQC